MLYWLRARLRAVADFLWDNIALIVVMGVLVVLVVLIYIVGRDAPNRSRCVDLAGYTRVVALSPNQYIVTKDGRTLTVISAYAGGRCYVLER